MSWSERKINVKIILQIVEEKRVFLLDHKAKKIMKC